MSTVTPLFAALAATLLQGPPMLPGGLLGKAIIAVVAIGIVVLVGRIVLSIAWKLVIAASVVVGVLWVLGVVL
jgi:hypothetical protein